MCPAGSREYVGGAAVTGNGAVLTQQRHLLETIFELAQRRKGNGLEMFVSDQLKVSRVRLMSRDKATLVQGRRTAINSDAFLVAPNADTVNIAESKLM